MSRLAALRGSDQIAHPLCGPDRAAEAVEVHADDVARLALQAVARERGEVLARVSVGDEARDAAKPGRKRPGPEQ